MGKFVLDSVELAGCAVVLGENTLHLEDEPQHWGHDSTQLSRLQKRLGMDARQVAAPGTTTGDMCRQAAASLMQAMNIDRQDVTAIVSVTQTPDYLLPGNAYVLHSALGLSKETVAIDVCQGCAGFVYGLWLAGMMARAAGGGGVLLCAGDTLSRAANKNDHTTAPIFGDAGSAAWIRFCPDAEKMYFVLRADGRELEKLYIPAGGARMPASALTGAEQVYEDGNTRSADNLRMDGVGIFSFTMAEQPRLLHDILQFSGYSAEMIDYFVMHQANRYIVETVAKKADIPEHKVPAAMFSRYGNLNSASIPGVLCGELAASARENNLNVVLQGFGVGLSWGACQTRLRHVHCLDPQLYNTVSE
ncbi:MAG: 3-oxoacyl-[acyl-carrier-protein] synthase III C-terminal domain-containing protein [Desulfovibrio sp.]|nr:3-oxoacyl-[acyl-carrier-protein] synthase III C-terminal domain-containing protein [Desulfovibrio sp.]